MAWWAWALIAACVIAVGALKLAFFNKYLENRKKKTTLDDEE